MGGHETRGTPAPIAVIGMSLRVPGASTPARFWRNLVEGRDCLSRLSTASLRRMGVPQHVIAHPDFVSALPKLVDVDRFDAEFFDMSSSEAEMTEPAHRLFLECAWEALEGAGIVPGRRAPVIGVFGGCEGNYRESALADVEDPLAGFNLPVRIGNAIDFLTTRVSHRFDLTGPSVAVMAACATSLMAIELAVQSLRRGDCEVALAGGATVLVSHLGGYLASVEGMLSPTGRLRPFDADADGTIFGDGAGVIALRPLADALAAGNPIHAVIRGSAASNDGHPPGKESIVAPSPEGQVAAIAAALADAGVPPDTIGYVEAHGTATGLGDPAEVAALVEVYRRHTNRSGFASLGSVKGNIGHTRCGAGVASVIKACLALSHRTIPPLANFATPNPRIDFAHGPFVVDSHARAWTATEGPRRAAVSSFGFGGSNVHVVLEEAPAVPATRATRSHHLLVVSARDDAALARRIGDIDAHLEAEPALAAADLARTLDEGRRAFAHRAAFVVAGDRAEKLGTPIAAGRAPDGPASVVFLFPGQGSQRYGAGRGLYATEPVFREAIDACAARLEGTLALDLRDLLGYGEKAAPSAEAASQLRRTAHAQPALFAVGYAAARLLMSWGVAPAAMLGHSLGEITAACLADVFTLDDALALVAARARLMQQCEPGTMAAIFAASTLVARWLPSTLEIAAVNAPAITVVSGPAEAVASFRADAERKGIPTQPIETSHAFHSRMMEPALPEFARVLAGIALQAPTRCVISNATGLPLTAAQATDPRYWADHIRHPVQFSAGAYYALGHPNAVFVEAGPGSALGDLVRRHDGNARVAAMLPASAAADEPSAARAALGALWCAGATIDALAASGGTGRLVTLPTYPFQRSRHWREDENAPPPDPRRQIYERAFRSVPLDPVPPLDARRTRIVCGSPGGLMQAVADRLVARGAATVVVEFGAGYARRGPRRYSIRPESREDWAAVLADMAEGAAPQVLHFGSVTGARGAHGTAEAFQESLPAGFFSLCAIAQAAHDRGIVSGLDVVTFADGLMRLDGEPGPRHAEKGALVGTIRDIPAELPDLTMRLVDLPALDAAPPDWLVDAVVDEACAASAGMITCLRPGERLEETLYALPNLPESRPRLRENGVVLITGGTGGLGLLFAGALYDLCRARFVLTALWDLPPEETWPERAKRDDRMAASLAGVLALRARGAEVTIVKADVSVRDDVARAIAFTRQRYGALHGVIHAAGVLHPTSVIDKTHASAHRVFAAKALGAFHLDALTQDDDLDMFMPVSSQASQVPEPGQVDYAAANAVLDVIADNRARRGRGYAGTIGWGPWQDVGIAADRMRQAVDAGVQRAMSGGRGVRDVEYDVLDHAVLRARAREVDDTLAYRGVLRHGHWLVDDHRLDGRPLLVGTAHLQLAATAFADHAAGAGAIELRDVAHLRPLYPHERGTEIEVRFLPSRGGERFTLRSRELGSRTPWVDNTTGEVRRVDATRRADLAPPARDAFDGLPDAPFGSSRLYGGPRWSWTRRSTERDGRAWHRIELPAEFASDLDVFDLHPALLDAAVSCTARGSPVQLIPHTYDTVRVHAPLERDILVRVVQHAAASGRVADVAILSPGGRLLAEIDGLVMRPAPPVEGATGPVASDAPAGARRVVVGDLGDLDSIRVAPHSRRAPGPGEVEVEVRATGLNFRDLLTALGEMPNVAAGLTPGSEVAGVVTAVGPGVKRLAVGDAVAGITRGALATHVTTSAHALAVLPPDLDFHRAAGVPLVFLTAQYALEKLARVSPGERVLIHAAAGGVGLAAIQIARRLRAEIYATAGDDNKRAYLRSLGIRHVFDSRSLSFADGVREATGGEGVDVVLNALAGPFIPASLALLRPQGRFIEIGKRDLIAGTALDLSPFLRNLTFAAFDLGQIVDARDPMLTTMLETLLDRFASGELLPLPTEVVPFERALDGFRRMARAEHIGKIVFEVSADATVRGAAMRAFSEAYGHGVPVDFGLDVFRRVLSWPHAPTYVLAMGSPVEGAAPAHIRVASSEKGRGRAGLKTPFRAPEGEVETALARLWEKTLGISPIGADDDFVELGGDSIEAIQIQHAIHREFDLRVKNTEFLSEPTIAALARLIDVRRSSSAPVANDAGMAVRA